MRILYIGTPHTYQLYKEGKKSFSLVIWGCRNGKGRPSGYLGERNIKPS